MTPLSAAQVAQARQRSTVGPILDELAFLTRERGFVVTYASCVDPNYDYRDPMYVAFCDGHVTIEAYEHGWLTIDGVRLETLLDAESLACFEREASERRFPFPYLHAEYLQRYFASLDRRGDAGPRR